MFPLQAMSKFESFQKTTEQCDSDETKTFEDAPKEKKKQKKKAEEKNHFSLDGVSLARQYGLVELCSLFLVLVELFTAEA